MKQKNLDIYGDEPIPWSRAVEQLEAGSAQVVLAGHGAPGRTAARRRRGRAVG